MRRRPTIFDIARECGVSTTAVSFALNGKPGISTATRERILTTARELGWTANVAARALSTSHVNAIGLVITAPLTALSRDTFYLQLIAGIEQELADTPVALVLKIVDSLEDELTALRTWVAENRVGAVILVNPRIDDPRPEAVAALGVRAVFLGDPQGRPEASFVFVDDAATMAGLVQDVAALGYSSLAYLHITSTYKHSQARLDALGGAAAEGIDVRAILPVTGADDDATKRAVHAHIDHLAAVGLPDLLMCEDESLTLAALDRLEHHGLRVPDDIGLMSWESTPGLERRSPTISSLDRDPMVLGAAAVEVLRELRRDPTPTRRVIEPPRLVVRDSLRRTSRAAVAGTVGPGADAAL
ncbi:MAG TPA: LacI family DNA-binding transcriptional regulator [Brachybacterium sp.]|nr:LacI family DNA-binding transcriptional regulator [Brachybacterium sp.]